MSTMAEEEIQRAVHHAQQERIAGFYQSIFDDAERRRERQRRFLNDLEEEKEHAKHKQARNLLKDSLADIRASDLSRIANRRGSIPQKLSYAVRKVDGRGRFTPKEDVVTLAAFATGEELTRRQAEAARLRESEQAHTRQTVDVPLVGETDAFVLAVFVLLVVVAVLS